LGKQSKRGQSPALGSKKPMQSNECNILEKKNVAAAKWIILVKEDMNVS
jgi:hypothetical protein